MSVQQSLKNPFGVTIFGSSIVRVEPDIVSLHFAVTRLEKRPKDAFNKARKAAEDVRIYLSQAKMDDVRSSRITLSQKFNYRSNETQLIGYIAKIAFHVLSHDLDQLEEILIGVIDAGVNEIDSVEYQTSRLKEIRAQARRQAISAAREKAEVYCEAAGVLLGSVIHIEDINPDQLRGREGHVVHETPIDDDSPLSAFDPGSITVGGAVMLAFELERESGPF